MYVCMCGSVCVSVCVCVCVYATRMSMLCLKYVTPQDDVMVSQPITCSESNDGDIDIVRGDGESVHRSGFSQLVKVQCACIAV